jgi:hypothetical protein
MLTIAIAVPRSFPKCRYSMVSFMGRVSFVALLSDERNKEPGCSTCGTLIDVARPGWRTDPMTHVVSRLCNALMMVTGLIPWIDNPSLDRVVQIACVEDWLTNYRLLIEFFVLKPPDNCAGVATLAPGWTPSVSVITAKLKADYGWASQDVSHIGLPKPNRPAGNAAPEALRMRADWLLEVAEEFAAELTRIGSPHGTMVGQGVVAARAAL